MESITHQIHDLYDFITSGEITMDSLLFDESLYILDLLKLILMDIDHEIIIVARCLSFEHEIGLVWIIRIYDDENYCLNQMVIGVDHVQHDIMYQQFQNGV